MVNTQDENQRKVKADLCKSDNHKDEWRDWDLERDMRLES